MTLRSGWQTSILVLLCFLISLLVWAQIDTRPPAWDETVHLHLASDYRDLLLHGTPIQTRWTAIYPPLYHISLIPSVTIGDASADKVILTHVAYLALLIWALLSFARGCGATAWIAVLAAVCFIAMPTVLWVTRRPLIDFALTAWVMAGLEWLRRTDGFRNRRAAAMWGVWSGLGMLLKPFYPLWFVGPVLLCLWQGRAVDADGLRRKFEWKNLCIAIGLTIVTAIPYYGWQGPLFFGNAAQLASEQGAIEGDPGFQSLQGWWYYIHALIEQAGVLLTSIIAVGLIVLLVNKLRARKPLPTGISLLLACVISGYVLFTFNHNKDLRYTLPMLPPLLMLAFWGVSRWLEEQRVAFAAVGLSLGLFAWTAAHVDPPIAVDWRLRDIGQLLEQQHDQQQPFLLAAVVANHPYFFSRNLTWTARTEGISLKSSSVGNEDANFSEFILLKTGDVGPGTDAATRTELEAEGRAFSDYYPQIASVDLPDGSQALIHRRDPTHVFKVGEIQQTDLEARLRDSLSKLIEGPLNVSISGTPQEWQRGLIRSINISGGPWSIRKIPVSAGNIVMRNAHLNLYRLWDHQQIGLVGFDALAPDITLRSDDLVAFIEKKARRAKNVTVQFDDGHIKAAALYSGINVKVDIALRLQNQPRALVAQLKSVHLGIVPVPGWLLGKVSEQVVSLDPVPSFPGSVDIADIRTSGDTLRIVAR